jgi:16S rRNA (guanine966-N2)-methyltransferase
MRIISGKYRGRQIATLKSGKLRPTSDQLRETLFDVLGPAIVGARLLDGYAGSGAVGLEALSRGASEVVFIEHHRAAVALIRKNLDALSIDSGYRLVTRDVLDGLERLSQEGERFDIVFLDPPYAEIREYHHALRELARSRLVGRDSLVVAEHSRHTRLEDRYGKLERVRLLRHGDAQLAFYRLAAEPLPAE